MRADRGPEVTPAVAAGRLVLLAGAPKGRIGAAAAAARRWGRSKWRRGEGDAEVGAEEEEEEEEAPPPT